GAAPVDGARKAPHGLSDHPDTGVYVDEPHSSGLGHPHPGMGALPPDAGEDIAVEVLHAVGPGQDTAQQAHQLPLLGKPAHMSRPPQMMRAAGGWTSQSPAAKEANPTSSISSRTISSSFTGRSAPFPRTRTLRTWSRRPR